ncbi:hypothetical protein EAF04_000662 [Stromatinia cepivora]|nr:hypothetical protein EAF04_000662 [Stromatinia cepivora]
MTQYGFHTNGTAIFVPYATAGEVIAAGVVFPVLGATAVALRFYIRNTRGNKVGLDDILILPALLMLIGMGATLVEGVRKHAIGYSTPPSSATTPEEVLSAIDPKTSIAEQVEFAVTLLMILAYGFIKSSIILFYRRVFVVGNGSAFRIFTWISLGIVVAWTIAFFFFFLFLCGTHFSAAWGSRAGLILYCSNSLGKEEGLYISEFLINILLVVMPMPVIWRLHMPFGRKLAVTGIFLLAFLALVASIIRLGIVISLTTESIATLHIDENLTLSTVFYWSQIEAGLALVACCLPTLKPLVSPQGIASVVASLRSVISLQSLQSGTGGSNRSRKSRDSRNPTTKGANAYKNIDESSNTELRGGHNAIMEMDNTATHSVVDDLHRDL